MTNRSITKLLTPDSQDLRKRNEERDCFRLIHKACRLESENEALKVQIARLMADVRSARRLCKLANSALSAATAENAKKRAVQAQENKEIDQLKTGHIQTHTRAACRPDSLIVGNHDSYALPIVARCHSDALSGMSTQPSSPALASGACLKHLDKLQEVNELNELLAQHAMTTSAGHTQNTENRSTATSDDGYNGSISSKPPATEASEQWMKFKAIMRERIRLRNSVKGPCLALRHLFDSDSASLPYSRHQEDSLASVGDVRLPATPLSLRAPPQQHTQAPLDLKPWSPLRETRGFLTVRSSLTSVSSREALMSVHHNMLTIHIQSSPGGAFENKVASIPAAHLVVTLRPGQFETLILSCATEDAKEIVCCCTNQTARNKWLYVLRRVDGVTVRPALLTRALCSRASSPDATSNSAPAADS